MSSSRWLVVAVLAVGCNALLHLDVVATDRDGDGVPDDRDNCPDVYNPDQSDRDHDGVGDLCSCHIGIDTDHDGIDDGCDACIGPGPTGMDINGDGIDDGCEPCPTATQQDLDHDGIDDGCDTCLVGGPHDEDGDGIPDACDPCPTVGDGALSDFDSDGIGDSCDENPANDTQDFLRLFDPFTVLDETVWHVLPDGWTVHDDQLHVAGDQAVDAITSTVAVSSSGFLVRTRCNGLGDGDAKHVVAIDASSAPSIATCAIDGQGFVTLTTISAIQISTTPIPLPAPVELELLGTDTQLSLVLTCKATAGGVTVVMTAKDVAFSPPRAVSLFDHGVAATFDYVWIVAP